MTFVTAVFLTTRDAHIVGDRRRSSGSTFFFLVCGLVFIARKQWDRVAEALAADEDDQLGASCK